MQYIPNKEKKLIILFNAFSFAGNRAIRKIPHGFKFDYDSMGNLLLKRETKRVRRALSVKRYIETMLVADESMFEYYGRKEDDLRQYLLSIMAIVSFIYI